MEFYFFASPINLFISIKTLENPTASCSTRQQPVCDPTGNAGVTDSSEEVSHLCYVNLC